MKNTKDIGALQRAQAEWANVAFPSQPIGAVIKHLGREVTELAAEPNSLSEQADCFLLLLDVNRKSGHTAEQLVRAACEKLEINKRRQWGPADAEGVCEHVRQS